MRKYFVYLTVHGLYQPAYSETDDDIYSRDIVNIGNPKASETAAIHLAELAKKGWLVEVEAQRKAREYGRKYI